MPYQTGSVNSFADLKTQMFSFLSSNGWTQEGSNIIKKGTVFAEITTGADYIELVGAKSSDGAGNLVDIFDQISDSFPVASPGLRMVQNVVQTFGDLITMTFPIAYHFHLQSSPVDEFWCLVEYNGGFCQNMGFGMLNKTGQYTGGEFYSSVCGAFAGDTAGFRHLSSSNTATQGVACTFCPFNLVSDYDSADGATNAVAGSVVHAEIEDVDWFFNQRMGATSAPYTGMTNSDQMYVRLLDFVRDRSESPINGVASLVPFILYGLSPRGNYMRLGSIENLRFARISNLNFGQIEDDGTDKWKFYPVLLKNAGDPEHTSGTHSGVFGLAVKYDGP